MLVSRGFRLRAALWAALAAVAAAAPLLVSGQMHGDRNFFNPLSRDLVYTRNVNGWWVPRCRKAARRPVDPP